MLFTAAAQFLSHTMMVWIIKGDFSFLQSETVFSLFGRQEKELAVGVALGSRLPDQAQLLRKLQKEQSSGFFLLRTLARKFGPYFLTGTLCIIFHDAFMFAIPQVLRWDHKGNCTDSCVQNSCL